MPPTKVHVQPRGDGGGDGEDATACPVHGVPPPPPALHEVAPPPPLARSLRVADLGASFPGNTFFSADGRWFAAAGQNKAVKLWDTVTGATAQACARPANILAAEISPDGKRFAVGAGDSRLIMHAWLENPAAAPAPVLWDVDAGADICGATFSPDGVHLATVDESSRCRIWLAESGEELRTLAGKSDEFDYRAGSRWGGHGVHLAGGLLACTGDGNDWKRVRLWRAPSWEVHATIKFDESKHCVRLSPDARTLACGGAGGLLHIFNLDDLSSPVRILAAAPDTSVRTVRFSPDGTLLAAGNWQGGFAVYDTRSRQRIQSFKHAGSNGLANTFSPQGDVLALGGQEFRKCVFHATQSCPPARRYELDAVRLTSWGPWVALCDKYIACADAGGTVAPSATGNTSTATNLVEVFERGLDGEVGRPCVSFDTGKTIETAVIFGNGLALRPDGEQILCVHEEKTVQIYALPSADEVMSLGPFEGRLFGCQWSSDGSFIIINGDFGARLLDPESGERLCSVEDNTAVSFATCLDSKLLVTAGGFKAVIVRDVSDVSAPKQLHRWEETSLTQGVYFEVHASGERIVYSTQNSVVVRKLACGTELARFGFTAAQNSQFCPTDPDVLAIGTGMGMGGNCKSSHSLCVFETKPQRSGCTVQRKIRLVSIERTQHLDCSSMMHSTFELEKISGWSVGWSVKDGRTLLRAAEADAVAEYDWERFKQTFEDGAFTVPQLQNLCTRHPSSVPALVAQHPDCINVQHSETGDTVLHHIVREYKDAQLLREWLSGGATFSPIANQQGITALHGAIASFNVAAVLALLENLSLCLNTATAPLLTDAVIILANKMPRLILQGFESIAGRLQTYKSFRGAISESQVRGSDALLDDARLDSGAATTDSSVPEADMNMAHGAQKQDTLWADIENMPESADGCQVACQVVPLTDFLGPPESSPLLPIIMNCDASVFKSELIKLGIQFKWENSVYKLVVKHVVFHVVCLVLSSLAMIYTTQLHTDDGSSSTTTQQSTTASVLQSVSIACQLISLILQALRLSRLGCALYMDSWWSSMDAAASACLLAGGLLHFADSSPQLLQTVGAVGVSLKWFGLLDWMRSFSRTGPLVRMITVVTQDIG